VIGDVGACHLAASVGVSRAAGSEQQPSVDFLVSAQIAASVHCPRCHLCAGCLLFRACVASEQIFTLLPLSIYLCMTRQALPSSMLPLHFSCLLR
jgi:hypothetical protein